MKIAIPIEDARGLESPVYGHFGSAPAFVVVDSESGAASVIDNRQLGHAHGQCNPIAALAGQTVDALITGGIGGRALELLNAHRIRVYRAPQPVTAAEVLKDFREKGLEEITFSDCCSHAHGREQGHGHATDGGCRH